VSWTPEHQIAVGGSVLSTAVGDDGAIYVAYFSFDPEEKSPSWARGWQFDLIVSRDGGETFGEPLLVATCGPDRGSPSAAGPGEAYAFPRSFGWPLLALDPRGSGRLYCVWGDYRNGDRDVFCTASADGGQTWSDPVRVNDDPAGNGADQLTQFVAVDPSDGAVYVLFYDRRDDPENIHAAVTLARSTDGGRTFANYAWGEPATDPRSACYGDYIGMDVRDGRVYAAWVEGVPSEDDPGRTEETVTSGDMTLEAGKWPFGPAAIKVGVADFGAGR
jgi:hypothetical protein